jgi:hypothetical protein
MPARIRFEVSVPQNVANFIVGTLGKAGCNVSNVSNSAGLVVLDDSHTQEIFSFLGVAVNLGINPDEAAKAAAELYLTLSLGD